MPTLSELKPCPFCGGKANARQHEECPEINIAGCADLDCIGATAAYDFASQEDAISAWNTRAVSPDAINALVEALRRFASVSELIEVETDGLVDRDELELLFADYLLDRFTVGDFHRARAALSAFEQEGRS